ncbi:MAG: Xaa-Pro dipeptidase [Hyphococcus sp.]|nr:MAG: Xaa-Pro dipeptidase [Marinicaulis sp.]
MKKFSALLIFILLIPFSVLAHDEEKKKAEDKPDQWTIVHAGTLIARPGEAPLRETSIVVKNDRIERVMNGYIQPEALGNDAAAKVIDLKGAYVLPGLIDAHVHFGDGKYTEKRGEDTGEATYRMLNIIENANKTLNAGYTTVRNPGASGWAVFAYRDGVRDGIFPGPRIFTAAHTIRVGADESDGACYDVSSCKKAVRRQINMGADWIKLYATCSGSKPCGKEHAPSVFLQEEIKAVIETANTHQIPVAAHAHGTAGINDALRAGVRTIEHGSYNDKTSRALFKSKGAYYVPTLSVQDRIVEDYKTATEEMKPVMEAFMETHPARVAAAYKAGVQIAAGSDAGVTKHGDNARELYWYVKIGMSEAEAIRSATIVNSEMLKKESDIGSIEVGKFADIIAVSKSPLEDIEALSDVGFVMAGGQIVKSEIGE